MKPFPLLLLLVLTLLLSCQNNGNQQDPDLLHRRLSDSTSVSGLTGDSVKLVRTANLQFKVGNVEEKTKAVSEVARQYGGMIYYQNFRNVEEGKKELPFSEDSLLVISTHTPVADLTVRVLAENLESFLYAAKDLGYYTGSSNLQVDDRSLHYLENALKQKNRSGALTSPRASGSKAPTTLETIQVKDDAIDKFIANKAIDADASYSTVSLSLYQNAVVRKEVIANYVVSDYELPFGERLVNALGNGWEIFLNFLLTLMHFWLFIVLFILSWVGYRYYFPKGKQTLASEKA